jgi:osmotically-inducible protein OsmY
MGDNELRQNVLAELEWEPSIEAAHVGVTAEDGVVTLTGHVATYIEKLGAERATRRVRDVRAIVQQIEVRPPYTNTTSDDEIAKRAVRMLDWDVVIPKGSVKVKVHNGWISLMGEVSWQYQKQAAEEDVRKLHGVKGVINNILIKVRIEATDIQRRIEDALKRHAEIEARGIKVSVHDGKVTLAGKVRDWSERRLLEDAAWSAPGVTAVDDYVSVG